MGMGYFSDGKRARREESALVFDSKEMPNAVARALHSLKKGELEMRNRMSLVIWCSCGEVFHFENFNGEFGSAKFGFGNFSFSANCKHDGLVQFSWSPFDPNKEEECRHGKHAITCIVFERTL